MAKSNSRIVVMDLSDNDGSRTCTFKCKLVLIFLIINLIIIGVYVSRLGSSSNLLIIPVDSENDHSLSTAAKSGVTVDAGDVKTKEWSTYPSEETIPIVERYRINKLFLDMWTNTSKSVGGERKKLEDQYMLYNEEDDIDDDVDDDDDDDDGESEDKTEFNGTEYVYNCAFPKCKKPSSLINWKPAPDSKLYFQPIDDKEQDGWVFSAYYVNGTITTTSADDVTVDENDGDDGNDDLFKFGGDNQDMKRENTVRILAMIRKGLKRKIYCRFYGVNEVEMGTRRGTRHSMKGGHGDLRFSSIFFECPLPTTNGVHIKPLYVSAIFEDELDQPINNRLVITYPAPTIRNFTVCFSPLHSNFDFTAQLLEAIEFNSLLGADYFFVYNFSISSQTSHILRYYESKGKLAIIYWPLPKLELWYYGQVLAVNDCIYRNVGVSKFVVITDTDELIIPSKHSSWFDLIQDIDKNSNLLDEQDDETKSTPKNRKRLRKVEQNRMFHPSPPLQYFGGWSFRSRFFHKSKTRLKRNDLKRIIRLNFTYDQKRMLIKFRSHVILNVRPEDIIFKHGQRSKLIIRPECVNTGGIHIVTKMNFECSLALVGHDTALVHHYRTLKENSHFPELELSALRFKDSFLTRIKHVLNEFPGLSYLQ